MAMANCVVCGGTGEADSGAPKPDGGWYTVPCECTMSPSPPPDVVEAARRLESWKNSADWNTHEYITDGTYDQDEDIETVCEWIIQQAAPGKP